MQEETKSLPKDNGSTPKDSTVLKSPKKSLVRTPREIIFNPTKGTRVDQNIVHFQYYNSFNYSMLTKDHQRVRLTLGVTSANPGEGKTLAASNLAVSLTLGYQRKTVLVDLNIEQPRLHDVFGISPLAPGLLEALNEDTIRVSSTSIDQLSVLTVGALRTHRLMHAAHGGNSLLVGLEHLGMFSEVIHSLEQEFDFVIVDMPPINTRNFPILFTNHLSGLVVVIDATKTKREDIDKLFRQVNERQVLGFVLNRVQDDGT